MLLEHYLHGIHRAIKFPIEHKGLHILKHLKSLKPVARISNLHNS